MQKCTFLDDELILNKQMPTKLITYFQQPGHQRKTKRAYEKSVEIALALEGKSLDLAHCLGPSPFQLYV